MPIETATNADYLIDSLRLHLGDTDSTAYRYIDSWLRTAIITSVKSLQKWWNYRYLVGTDNNVSRNSALTYLFAEPPTIQTSDERAIILMAGIIIKAGSLEENAWDVGSWRDAEISYSNIEGNRAKEFSIRRDLDELYDLLKPPMKRLVWISKQSLPGYKGNDYEYGD